MKADNKKLKSEIRENNAKLEAKIDGINSRLEGKIEALTQRVDQNFAFLNMSIDGVQTSVYWGFAALSIIIAFITFFPAIGDFLKNFRKPLITREEVETMINSAFAKRSNS